jgi:glycosyltransferase involved in cell wall biosynthesis
MQQGVSPTAPSRLLHAIVGHKFPHYFENCVKSVLSLTKNEDVIVTDNASNDPDVIEGLRALGRADTRVRLLLRTTNDLSRNRKVGGLYQAYNEIMEYALDQGYSYVHIMQHDMQLLWWDDSVMRRAQELFTEFPECVNIQMLAYQWLNSFTDTYEYLKPRLMFLPRYGLTDTGLYDLTKWRARGMRFGDREQDHARKYRNEGLKVFCHPLPTVAPIPWPAVVRNGKIVGREVRPSHEFILRPLSPVEIVRVKESLEPVWSEDVCVPWGWTCLTPYWVSDLRKFNYLIDLQRAIRRGGLRAAWPRWERRGLPDGLSLSRAQRYPRFGMLPVVVTPIWYWFRRTVGLDR